MILFHSIPNSSKAGENENRSLSEDEYSESDDEEQEDVADYCKGKYMFVKLVLWERRCPLLVIPFSDAVGSLRKKMSF